MDGSTQPPSDPSEPPKGEPEDFSVQIEAINTCIRALMKANGQGMTGDQLIGIVSSVVAGTLASILNPETQKTGLNQIVVQTKDKLAIMASLLAAEAKKKPNG